MKRYVVFMQFFGENGKFRLFTLYRRKWLFFWERITIKDSTIGIHWWVWPNEYEALRVIEGCKTSKNIRGIFTPFLPIDGKVICKIRA